ncbi:hypothetical protein WHR41_09487 [Cladosporium halotolerans]|uniref:mitogen-activated protein kinase n=1 Tax=Cladosporium halotolerans TaxID=1052096 RepID=A0AB34KDA8_9PEZI
MEDGGEALSRPVLQSFVSSGTGTSGKEVDYGEGLEGHEMYSDRATARHFLQDQTSSVEGGPLLTSSSSYGWVPTTSVSSRTSARPPIATPYSSMPTEATMGGLRITQQQPIRPGSTREYSNVYAPPRRSHRYASSPDKFRVGSGHRGRIDPNAEYRAQEEAYVQRIRWEAASNNGFFAEQRRSSPNYSDGSSEVDESPGLGSFVENDPYGQGALLYYEEQGPSQEQLKVSANRERLEWHAMLANVLTGDIVKQEKTRLIRGSEQQGDDTLKTEVWVGVRAKTCGRSVTMQRRLIEEGRNNVKQTIEHIIAFEVRGEAEVGKSPLEQVQQVVNHIEKVERLYPTQQALQQAQPLAASAAYRDTSDAVVSWRNVTELINTELGVLRQWVGNIELDFTKSRALPLEDHNGHLLDEGSFIDRILKEDRLRPLEGENSLLEGINTVINKAKATLILNARAFAERHLPSYIEELLTLINFPTRLIQEIIRMRLSYAKNMKDPARHGVMMAEQMNLQLRIILTLAVKIKEAYLVIARPQPGWALPPCIDEDFDGILIDALRFYFKMLDLKLMANRNTFKEAEILEQEWNFCYQLGSHLEGGDVEVAEQFSFLTARSLNHLTTYFEKELVRPPEDVGGAETDKRYKSIFDSVRARQRKIFRFSKVLSQRFENATEYNMNMAHECCQDLLDALASTGHFLVEAESSRYDEKASIHVIASPALQNRRRDIESMLGTCCYAEDTPEDPSNPYMLILCCEHALRWGGGRMDSAVRLPRLGIKTGRLRVVADGSLQRLANANAAFAAATGVDLDILVEHRSNLQSIDLELRMIRKTAYKLSNTIIDSVEIVRRQTVGLERKELIQTCFAFATEFGQRSAIFMDRRRRAMHQLKMTHIAVDWVSFICNDCVASDRKTFRWAVIALECAVMMTRGRRIMSISETEYATLGEKVARCMSLLVSHFDLMGARGSVAAQTEKQRLELMVGKVRLNYTRLKGDEESSKILRAQRLVYELNKIDLMYKDRKAERQALGNVLEDSNEADRALTRLSASAGNVHLRWQQGQSIGSGTFGSVYAAINLDSGQLMAVKEIRLQDPKLIPTIVSQIRDEMGVLQVLDHPNIVQYYGIEPHRDKVYIFMEYCSGGSLAGVLEQGRVEDETVIQVYALQMLEGLGYLHEAKVVHRDIKPENILLDHNGIIKFVDFGAAKLIANQGKTMVMDGPSGKPSQEPITGTPMYMSPEVIKGGKHRRVRLGAVDVWSLGCVVTEMATGTRPWASHDNEWAIMYNIARGYSPQMPTKDQLSNLGLDFLRRCFGRDPSKRASAAELLQHEWILNIKSQMDLKPETPQTPAREGLYEHAQPEQWMSLGERGVIG